MKMKQATALLLLLALAAFAPAAAQEAAAEQAELAEQAEQAEQAVPDAGMTLDELLEAHYEAVGGKENWDRVEAVRFAGVMSMGPGMEAPFTMTMKRPDQIRLEFTFQGMTGIQASDGETAWMVMPFMGKTDPEEMPAEQAEQLKEQADIEGPLFDWEVEGTEAYKVKVTLANGETRYHFLDSEYFVTIRQESQTTIQGQEIEIETTIGDYKELCLETSSLVDDETPCEGAVLLLPFSIEGKPKGAPSGQVITIETVTINPDGIADDYFSMPAAPVAEAAG